MRRRRLVTAISVAAAALGVSALATTTTAGAATLYAPNYGTMPEAINAYATAADGSLSALTGSPFPVSGAAGGLITFAFTPDGGRAVSTFLFNGGVLGFSIGPGGEPNAPQGPTLTPSVTGLAVSPDGRFAYAPTRDFMGTPPVGILGYSIDANGALNELAASPFASGEFGDVAITPDGRYLFAVVGNNVERFSIAPNGTLSDLGAPAAAGGARFLTVSPDGRFLFVGTDSSADGVTSYAIGADGSLTQVGLPALTGDVSLSYFAVSPDGRFIYMPDSNVDAIVVAAVAADGSPTVVGSTPIEDVETVAVSPDGRYLYWGKPGDTIGVASIGANGVPVILPGTVPWPSGEPERFTFRPAPTPVARFTASAAAPGAPVSFNASGSTGAARFDWDFGDGTTLANGGPSPSHVYAQSGAYDVRLTLSDANGCSVTQVYTGQSTTCPGGAGASTTARIDTLPVLSRLSVTNRRFAVAAGRRRKAVKRGTRFTYTLSEAATVAFRIERRAPGRRVAGKCRRITKANRGRRKCIRFVRATAFNRRGSAGANRTRFSGKLARGRQLAPGSYRATARAIDSAGGRSGERRVAFTVVRP